MFDDKEEDPLLRSSRREMKVVIAFALVFAIWSVGYCALNAYDKPAEGEPISLGMGMPSWVFWGVILPWGVAALFTVWFATGFMKDHVLDDHAEREDLKQGNDASDEPSGGEAS